MTAPRPLASVVVPAHDEARVIDRCLGALLEGAAPGEFEVVVVANGCSDDTASRARRHGPDVTVLELPAAGKTGALNAGDDAAVAFPRVYLDADVELGTAAARAVVGELTGDTVQVAGARPTPDLAGCSVWVRAYTRVWAALPVLQDRYVGSGVFAVSAAGHRRLAPFPPVVADDLWARRVFAPAERATADVGFTTHPPRGLVDLLRRLVRVRAGNVQLESGSPGVALAGGEGPRGVRGLLATPGVAVGDRLVFVGVSVLVRVAAWVRVRRGRTAVWSRDESSRVAA
ncbi:glycosyltransferase family 2 protein [Geodermatophilus sp. Leaf369]|uniref:glycosyltransferase n=1 Tax=Geodermatophilus sp. Leaf369 TaxID=1736354 RepID=UPI0009EBEEA1|nr:glycosyltransferase [Geodermatophilus sp. Leaf369]